jgi:hypothetical protein
MRPFVIVVATCLACTHAPAQVAQSTPSCPSPDSVWSSPHVATSVPAADGRSTIRVRDGGFLRYITYVVDSQYVVLIENSASPPANSTSIDGLSADDIEDIIVIKETDGPPTEWRTWHSCPGVPVMLIQTRSKRWRPRVAGGGKSGE